MNIELIKAAEELFWSLSFCPLVSKSMQQDAMVRAIDMQRIISENAIKAKDPMDLFIEEFIGEEIPEEAIPENTMTREEFNKVFDKVEQQSKSDEDIVIVNPNSPWAQRFN